MLIPLCLIDITIAILPGCSYIFKGVSHFKGGKTF